MHPFIYSGVAAQGEAVRLNGELPDPDGYWHWHVRELTFARTSAQVRSAPFFEPTPQE